MDIQHDPARGLFGISTAAELVGIPPQSMRLYESRGLLEPTRTDGGTRRYSNDDLDRLRRIGELLAAGLNIAGVAMVLDLEERNATLRAGLDEGRRSAGRGGQAPAVGTADCVADLSVKNAGT